MEKHLAKIPDDRNLGRRPTAAPSRGRANLQVAATGLAEAANTQSRAATAPAQALQVGTQTAEAFQVAEDRIRTRDDAVSRARAVSGYAEQSANELRRIRTEEDLSDRAVAGGYIQSLRESAADVLSQHSGSEESKASLAIRLEQIRTQYTDQAANARLEAQNTLVTETIGTALSNVTANAYQSPSQYDSLLESWDGIVDDMMPALTTEQELVERTRGRQEITINAVSRLLDDGEWQAARRFMNERPAAVNSLSPAQQRGLMERVVAAEQQESSARNGFVKGQEALDRASAILGIPQANFTPEIRAQIAGLSQGDPTLTQEIAEISDVLGRPLSEYETLLHLGLTPDTPETERRAQQLALDNDIDIESARGLIYGTIQATSPDKSGNVASVNLATGTVRPMGNIAGGDVAVISTAERARLQDQNATINRVLGLSTGLEEAAALASGPAQEFLSAVNILAGFAGSNAPIPAPRTAEAREAIKLYRQSVSIAFANNPRFPVAEINRILSFLPDEGAFLANPSLEARKIPQLRDYLMAMRTQNMMSLGIDPTPTEEATEDLPEPTTPEEYEALPSGTVFRDPGDGQAYRKP